MPATRVMRVSLRAIGTRAAGAVAQFATLGLLARAADPQVLGLYVIFMASQRVAATLGAMGLPHLVTRNLAVLAPTAPDEADRVLSRVRVLVRRASVASATAGGAAAIVAWSSHHDWLAAVAAGVALSGILASSLVTAEGLKAVGRPELGLLLEFTAAPIGVAIASGGALLLGRTLDFGGAIAFYAASGLIALGASSTVLRSDLGVKRVARRTQEPRGDGRGVPEEHIRPFTSFTLFAIANAALPSIPILVAPAVLSLADVGVLGAVLRVVAIPTLLVGALASTHNPQFSSLAAGGSRDDLRRALARSQIVALTLYLPFLAGFLFFGEAVLQVVGPDFASGATALRIVAIGQAFNAATGVASGLLLMSQRQAVEARIVSASALGQCALVLSLGSLHGMLGAASAISIAVGGRNAMSYVFARRHIRSIRGGQSSEYLAPLPQVVTTG